MLPGRKRKPRKSGASSLIRRRIATQTNDACKTWQSFGGLLASLEGTPTRMRRNASGIRRPLRLRVVQRSNVGTAMFSGSRCAPRYRTPHTCARSSRAGRATPGSLPPSVSPGTRSRRPRTPRAPARTWRRCPWCIRRGGSRGRSRNASSTGRRVRVAGAQRDGADLDVTVIDQPALLGGLGIATADEGGHVSVGLEHCVRAA